MAKLTGEKQQECARCWKVYHVSELTKQRGVLVCWRCVDEPPTNSKGMKNANVH